MLNHFEAINQARSALEQQGCCVVACSRRALRPVITAHAPDDLPLWPVVAVEVCDKGVKRTVRTSRVYDCQIIWQ